MLKSTVALLSSLLRYDDVISDILNDMTQDMLTTVDHLFCPNQKTGSPTVLSENTDGITIQGIVFWMIQLPLFFWKISRKYKRRLCDLAYVTQPPDL